MAHTETSSADMERCIQRCTECRNVCLQTIAHCLRLGGKHASPEHIGLLMDCAAICETSSRFMLNQSPFHKKTCSVCAEVCTACADDCEKMAGGDRVMQMCADTCRSCAESCAHMAA